MRRKHVFLSEREKHVYDALIKKRVNDRMRDHAAAFDFGIYVSRHARVFRRMWEYVGAAAGPGAAPRMGFSSSPSSTRSEPWRTSTGATNIVAATAYVEQGARPPPDWSQPSTAPAELRMESGAAVSGIGDSRGTRVLWAACA